MTAPVMPLLSHRQRQLLTFIRGYAGNNGHCPTLREVAAGCGLQSPSAVQYHLFELKRMGWISWVPGRARTIRVLNPVDGTDS